MDSRLIKVIKIAQGTYCLANRAGVLSVYLTYCKCKAYNSQGRFSRSAESVKALASFLQTSESTTRKHLARLVKLGFIQKDKKGYKLESYDSVWGKLGLNLRVNECRKGRLGSFAIFKVENLSNFKEQIQLLELQHHINKEASSAKKSILNDNLFTDSEKNRVRNLTGLELIQTLDEIYLDRFSVLKCVENNLEEIESNIYRVLKGTKTVKFAKITPHLTCARTAFVLGYSGGSASGQMVREGLESANLAKFEARSVSILNTKGWDDAVKAEKMLSKYSSRLKEDGFNLKYTLVSKMEVL